MIFNKTIINPAARDIDLKMINDIAKYLRGFNDSLLIERGLNMDEIKLLNNIFAC